MKDKDDVNLLSSVLEKDDDNLLENVQVQEQEKGDENLLSSMQEKEDINLLSDGKLSFHDSILHPKEWLGIHKFIKTNLFIWKSKQTLPRRLYN